MYIYVYDSEEWSTKKTTAFMCCEVEGASAEGCHETVVGRSGEEVVMIELSGTKDVAL